MRKQLLRRWQPMHAKCSGKIVHRNSIQLTYVRISTFYQMHDTTGTD